jgi:hypothetical protein
MLHVQSSGLLDQFHWNSCVIVPIRPGRSGDRPLERGQQPRPDLAPPNEEQRRDGIEAGPSEGTGRDRADGVQRQGRHAAEDEQQARANQPPAHSVRTEILQCGQQRYD